MTARSVKDWARHYINRGWQVVPLAPGTKACRDEDWLRLIFKPEDFEPEDNIGIRSVQGLVVLDLDCAEAVAMAEAIMPATGCIYGRPSKPKSKFLYTSTFEKTHAFKDVETNNTLLEIRANHQDMAPPSRHPNGETLSWDREGAVAIVEAPVLLRAGQLLATAVLIGRYYAAAGARHDWCLALAGTLKHVGLTAAEVRTVITAASHYAGDPKLDDRLTEVRTTFDRADDDPVKGTKALKELTSKNFVTSIQKIWGSGPSIFILDDKGEKILANNQENIRRAIEKLEARLSYDLFSERPLLDWHGRVDTLQDDTNNELYLTIDEKFHFRPSIDFFTMVVQRQARQNAFHPVRDYLEKVKWDGEPRLDTWLIQHGQAADTPYVRAVSSLVLKGAVRRIMSPGCKFDELMVLESSQGMFKSSMLRALCPNEAWFSDDLPLDVDAKQMIERTLGKWIIEASDLSGMHKAQAEQLKAMLSRQKDGPVRLAYARLPVERQRQFIIIGTTNSHQYLADATGNRRFWPIRVSRFNLDGVLKDRDQLWAEAYHRERAGESIRLRPELYGMATMQQERRRIEDAWEPTLSRCFNPDEEYRLTYEEIWEKIGIPVDRRDDRGQRRLMMIMQQLGFRRITVSRNGIKVKGWARDPGTTSGKLFEENE